MFTRGVTTRILPVVSRIHVNTTTSSRKLLYRPKGTVMNFSSFHPHVQSTLNQIDQLVPRFPLTNDQINIIKTPNEFYEILKQKISMAEKRIFLSTLYIGKTETELVDCLDNALSKNPDIEVHILSDALRGTRESPNPCSASLLSTLVEKHGSRRVQVCMYHTPNLHGLKRHIIPHRFNEGWGLQHMKLYGFDDEIILSGANLSNDYFTNRQDRYILFKSKSLTDYYFKIHQAISNLSYKVLPQKEDDKKKRKGPGFKLVWPHVYTLPEPTVDPVNFIKEATKIIRPLLGPQNSPGTMYPEEEKEYLTYAYPISQFSQLLTPKDYSTEFIILSRVLSMIGTDRFNWTLTAGYFNIHPDLKDKLLNTKPDTFAQVITAAPEANGFYKSKGVSGLLPAAYSQLSMNFLDEVIKREKQVDLFEWKNGIVNTPQGWSYHAKGIWITNPGETNPFMTVIGSSNYTRRAYTHDLESNVLLVTKDPELQEGLQSEIDNLKRHTTKMDRKDFEREDRKPDWRQKTFIKYMGDKL